MLSRYLLKTRKLLFLEKKMIWLIIILITENDIGLHFSVMRIAERQGKYEIIRGFCKIRFSYKNKSIFIIMIYIATLFFKPIFVLYYMILIFNTWGLKFNCPCMFIYERYSGCPCFGWISKCRVNK